MNLGKIFALRVFFFGVLSYLLIPVFFFLKKRFYFRIQYLLQKCLHMKYLGLRQCKMITSEFISAKLRHSCPNLRIAVESPKDKPIRFDFDL
jgi:hypothetical protein